MNKKHLLFFLIFPISIIILSCWNSSPTSDKTKAYYVGGSVTDKNGTGIEGVAVQISGTNFSSSDTTDTGGEFSFNNVKAGSYKVKATKDSSFFKPASLEFKVGDTDIDTLYFTTAKNYIHGRVLDILTGKGIEGVDISLVKYQNLVSSAMTDNDGCFGFYDLEKSNYTYFYYPNYYIAGSNDFSLKAAAFDNPEIVLPDYYISNENLTITKAEFNTETKTLSLEWKPSLSEYINLHFVYIMKKPEDIKSGDFFAHFNTGGYYVSSDNKDTSEMKYLYVMRLFDENTISAEVFIGIAPVYKIGNISYYGPCSDTIKIRLYW